MQTEVGRKECTNEWMNKETKRERETTQERTGMVNTKHSALSTKHRSARRHPLPPLLTASPYPLECYHNKQRAITIPPHTPLLRWLSGWVAEWRGRQTWWECYCVYTLSSCEKLWFVFLQTFFSHREYFYGIQGVCGVSGGMEASPGVRCGEVRCV